MGYAVAMSKGIRLVVSLGLSLGILALLLREVERPVQEITRALMTMGLGVWVLYALAQLGQGWPWPATCSWTCCPPAPAS